MVTERNQEVVNLMITFTEVDAGWICYDLKAGEKLYSGWFSWVYDPLPDLRSWLEAIAVGVQQTSFLVDEEGFTIRFNLERERWDLDTFTLSQADDEKEVYINCHVTRKELIKTFYTGYLNFAYSTNYKASEWDFISGADKLSEFFRLPEKQLVHWMMALGIEKLKLLLNNLNSGTLFLSPPQNAEEGIKLLQEFATGNKVITDYLQTDSPNYYHIPPGYDLWNEEEQMRYILVILKERISGYGGTRPEEFRSTLLEEFLRANP